MCWKFFQLRSTERIMTFFRRNKQLLFRSFVVITNMFFIRHSEEKNHFHLHFNNLGLCAFFFWLRGLRNYEIHRMMSNMCTLWNVHVSRMLSGKMRAPPFLTCGCILHMFDKKISTQSTWLTQGIGVLTIENKSGKERTKLELLNENNLIFLIKFTLLDYIRRSARAPII